MPRRTRLVRNEETYPASYSTLIIDEHVEPTEAPTTPETESPQTSRGDRIEIPTTIFGQRPVVISGNPIRQRRFNIEAPLNVPSEPEEEADDDEPPPRRRSLARAPIEDADSEETPVPRPVRRSTRPMPPETEEPVEASVPRNQSYGFTQTFDWSRYVGMAVPTGAPEQAEAEHNTDESLLSEAFDPNGGFVGCTCPSCTEARNTQEKKKMKINTKAIKDQVKTTIKEKGKIETRIFEYLSPQIGGLDNDNYREKLDTLIRNKDAKLLEKKIFDLQSKNKVANSNVRGLQEDLEEAIKELEAIKVHAIDLVAVAEQAMDVCLKNPDLEELGDKISDTLKHFEE